MKNSLSGSPLENGSRWAEVKWDRPQSDSHCQVVGPRMKSSVGRAEKC